MPEVKDKIVVEIGPGLGDLTKALMRISAVEAYEVDESLYEYLKETFKEEISKMRLNLRFGDVLEHWSNGNLQSSNYFLVANIPYYITTPIVRKALEDINCVGMILMMQKEVADKLVATEGSKYFCSLSVLAQVLGDLNVLFEVPSHAFNPPPKVTSAVVRIDKKTKFSMVFKAIDSYVLEAFSHPRKRLFKNLLQCYGEEKLSFAFEKLELAQNLRPHELSSETHLRLFYEITA